MFIMTHYYYVAVAKPENFNSQQLSHKYFQIRLKLKP